MGHTSSDLFFFHVFGLVPLLAIGVNVGTGCGAIYPYKFHVKDGESILHTMFSVCVWRCGASSFGVYLIYNK